MNIWLIIAVVFIIAAAGYWLGQRAPSSDLAQAQAARFRKKERRRQAVLALFETNTRITNNDVEKSLGVSDSTATRLLQALVDDGLIEAYGETKGTYYTRR